jgi:hypothetical protein
LLICVLAPKFNAAGKVWERKNRQGSSRLNYIAWERRRLAGLVSTDSKSRRNANAP